MSLDILLNENVTYLKSSNGIFPQALLTDAVKLNRGERKLSRRTVFGILSALLIVGILSFALDIRTVAGDYEVSIVVGTTDSVEDTLDPAQAYDYFGWCMLQQIAGTLVSVKPGSTSGVDYIPELAADWNVSEDSTVWDFTLRRSITLSDDTECNATHIKYTFDRAIALIPSIPEGAPAGLGYDVIINHIEVLDTYRVRFYLNFPFSPFLGILACRASSIVDPKYAPMAKVDYVAGNARASTPVAFVGPYILSKWERVAGRDIEIQLDANPFYWNSTSGYPKTEHVAFKFYSDPSSLRLAVETGEVDVAFRDISPTDVPDLEDNPSVKVWRDTGTFIQYLCFQTKRPPFNDTRVRVAVTAALDRRAVCETVFLNLSDPLYSIIPPSMLGHTEAFQKLGDANYTLTTSLLTAAGYDATHKLEFDLWYESSGHYPMSAEQAVIYKEALEASGLITVTLQSADWPSYRQNRDNEIMDAYIYGWHPDYVDPDDYAFLYWASWLHTNYNNPTQVDLYDQARATTNITLREELYAQIDEIAVQQCSVVPIYVGSTWAVTKLYVYGVCLDITQDMRYWLIYINPWVWVSNTVTGAYGEAVVGTSDAIYIARKNSFYRYNTADKNWTALAPPPNPDSGDAFKTGTALTWDFSDYIYALYGAATYDNRTWFYRYSISHNAWEALANTTADQGEGDSMTWVGNDNCLYATIGGEQRPTHFMRYDPSTDSWNDTPADPPAGMGDGASIVWTGDSLYALRGEDDEVSPLYDFWRYSLTQDVWTSMANIPAEAHDGGGGGVGDGGSLLYVGFWRSDHANYIYALSGNQAHPDNIPDNRTYRYSISTNKWERLADLYFGVGYYVGCRVGYADGHIYAWQGTPSTWPGGGDDLAKYELPPDSTSPTIGIPSRTPEDDVLPEQPVNVSVNVTDSESGVKNVTLSYTINNGTSWENVTMNPTINYNVSASLYEATIPGQQAETWVKFRMVAYDYAGNSATRDGTEPYCVYQVIPEFASALILPLLMIFTLTMVVLSTKRKMKP